MGRRPNPTSRSARVRCLTSRLNLKKKITVTIWDLLFIETLTVSIEIKIKMKLKCCSAIRKAIEKDREMIAAFQKISMKITEVYVL